ncbi:MAG: hypothetical protein HDQ88_11970 [Clostridia bacterium]|nr:hypothetical protein [Clostridia bacterium]
MSYELDDDDKKFLDLRYKLWRDIEWPLNRIKYTMEPPVPGQWGLADELEDVIWTLKKIIEGIESHMKEKARAKKNGV